MTDTYDPVIAAGAAPDVRPATPPYGETPVTAELGPAGAGTPLPPPSAGGGWGGWGPPAGGYWQTPPPTPPRTPRRALWRALLLVAVALAVLAGVGIGRAVWEPSGTVISPPPFGGAGGAGGSTGQLPEGGSSSGSPSSGLSNQAASAIAAKVNPGLVDIYTTLTYQNGQAAGTGMVLTSSGEVLTNNHVIEGATEIRATDVGNGRTYSATVVGYDASRDVAVLQLKSASGLATVTTGNATTLKVGDTVLGIGNAGGLGGTPSVAVGRVTALDQSITAMNDFGGGTERLTGLIRTDAAIQPGDSGGPLVDTSARVVGIDTAASASFTFNAGDNAGFAIPINAALSVARQIEAGNASATVHIGPTAFLGVEVRTAGGQGAGGIPGGAGGGATGTPGAVVVGVPSGTPAEGAGLVAGDVITGVDGTTITSAADLTKELTPHHPGDQVGLTWVDPSGRQHTASIRLGTGPPQ